MSKVYILIISLTLNSICIIVNLIANYLDFEFIERQANDTFFHPYTAILTRIIFVSGLILALCVILIVIFVIINVITLIKKYHKNDLIALEKSAKTIKIGLIPFWIFQFCLIIGSIYKNSTEIYANDLPMFINSLLDFNVIYYFVTSYFILLFSSIFSIGYIKLLFKNNKIDKEMFNIHKAMQLFFVTDIISIVRLTKNT